MGYPIKYLLLNKAELQYEVAIRGEVPANIVRELRCQVTKLTPLYPSEDILDSVYDFEIDISGIKESLKKVQTYIHELNETKQQSLIDRTRSLLNHTYFRLLRINRPANSIQEHDLKERTALLNEYYCNLDKLLLGENQGSVPAEHENRAQGDESPNTNMSEELTNLKISVTCDRGITGDLSKLKFDGKTCVRSFIQRIEEFRISKGLSHEKMFGLAYDLFLGDALHWFRSIVQTLSDSATKWDDLITKLKADFDIVDYDYRMLSEIRLRTQGEGENIIIYLAVMQGMFARLSKHLSEDEMLDILLHNIRPVYTQILATCPTVKSIDQLRELCKNYEQVVARAASFKEPPSSTSNTLAPEFSYKSNLESYKNMYKPSSSKLYYKHADTRQHNEGQTNRRVFALEATKKVFCNRCRVNTHSMKECPAERIVFCFKCDPNVTQTQPSADTKN